MKPVEVSLEQVLLARENRAGRQQRLLAQYGLPLVSFTMNMAGPVKDTPLSRFAFQAGVAALTKRLGGPVSCCLTEAVTGCEALLVYDRPAQALKDVCMELESTEVGRLYDLDVLDAAGEKLSRPEMRRCLVCDGPLRPAPAAARMGWMPSAPRRPAGSQNLPAQRSAILQRMPFARRRRFLRNPALSTRARMAHTRIWTFCSCSAAQRRSGRGFAGWSASDWTALHLRSCRMQDGRQRHRCCRRPAA